MPLPSVSVLARRLLLLQHELDALANGSKGLLEQSHLVFPRHVATRQLEVFLITTPSALNTEETTKAGTDKLLLDRPKLLLRRCLIHGRAT